MIISALLLLVGFLLVIKGADLLVTGASSLAKRMNVSELVIGLTVVAFGTSAPELVVNIIASINDHHDVVLGNIIGSNIFNLFLILGLSAIVYPITVQASTIWKEIPLSLFAALLLLFLVNDSLFFDKTNSLSLFDAIILLVLFSLFLIYMFKNSKNESNDEVVVSQQLTQTKTWLYISGGLVGLILGGKFVVDNAIDIARELEVSEKLIGLTIVSIGTSLPELATSIVAAYKKKSDLAIGNVIGSNIFNILFVLGISGIISPIDFNLAFNTDLMILVGGTLFLLLTMVTGKRKKVDRWEGVLFILFFIAYLSYLIYQK